MGAFLSGLLGAAGQDIDKQEQRRYDEKRQERMDRMKILELAMSNPHLNQDQLDPLFKELQGIADDSHYKSENKGIKDPFLQMLKPVKYIFGRQKQKQQQQQAQQQYRADVQNAPGVTAQPQMTGPGSAAYEAKTWGGPGARAQQPTQVPQLAQGRQTPPMPPPRIFRTRAEDKAEAEEEFQTGLKHEGVSSKAKTQQQLEKVEQLKQYFIDKEHLDEKTASEEANLAVFGSALKKPGSSKLTKEWITRPGSEDPEHVWVDPSGGFIDMNTGDPIPKEGVKTSGPPSKERLMQAIQGYYHHYIGQGYSHKDALAKAGDDFREFQGRHLSRLEQQMRMDEAASSIGPGRGFSQPTVPSPAKPTAQPGAPPAPQPAQPGNVPRGTPAMPPPRVVRPAPAARPSAATAPLRSTLNPQELENADYFVGTLTGAQKGTGKSAIRTQLGQRALEKVGLTPEILTARAERRKATAKATEKITTIVDSVDGLEKALARHGAVLTQLRPQLPDTDVKKLNEWLTSGAIEFNVKGVSEAAVRYGLALQAVRNEYGRVIAGGAASAGTTPVEAMREAGEKMSGGFTTGNTKAMVNQLGIEAKQKSGGYREQLKEMQDEMSQPLAPELRGGKYQEIQQTPPPGGGSRIKIINVEPA